MKIHFSFFQRLRLCGCASRNIEHYDRRTNYSSSRVHDFSGKIYFYKFIYQLVVVVARIYLCVVPASKRVAMGTNSPKSRVQIIRPVLPVL